MNCSEGGVSFVSNVICCTFFPAIPPFIPHVTSDDDTSNFDDFEKVKSVHFSTASSYERNTGFTGKDLPFIGFTFSKMFPSSEKPPWVFIPQNLLRQNWIIWRIRLFCEVLMYWAGTSCVLTVVVAEYSFKLCFYTKCPVILAVWDSSLNTSYIVKVCNIYSIRAWIFAFVKVWWNWEITRKYLFYGTSLLTGVVGVSSIVLRVPLYSNRCGWCHTATRRCLRLQPSGTVGLTLASYTSICHPAAIIKIITIKNNNITLQMGNSVGFLNTFDSH